MRRVSVATLLCVAVAACGDPRSDATEDVTFAELCGGVEPVRLLPLAEDEMIPWDQRSVAAVEGRFVLGVRDRVDISTFYAGVDRPGAARRLVSVDACGGDERSVAEDVDTVFVAPRPGAPSFACAGGEDRLTWIDPLGVVAAREVGAVGCALAWVDDRAVFELATGPDGADLVAARFDGTGALREAEILAQNVAAWERRSLTRDRFPVGDEPTGRVFALADRQLLDIDVRTAQTRVIAEDVRSFGAQYPVLVYFGDAGVFLLDLDQNIEIEIDSPFASFSQGPIFGPGTVALVDPGGWAETGFITLEDHEVYTRTYRWSPLATMSDGTRLLRGGVSTTPYGLYRWRPGENQEYLEGPPLDAWFDEGDVWLLTHAYGEHERTQEIAVLDDPTLERRVVVENVYRPQRMSDEAWLTVRAEVGQVAGDLLLVHADDNTATQLVDRNVHLEFSAFTGGPAQPPADGTVIYVVVDGERSGLWTARLAP